MVPLEPVPSYWSIESPHVVLTDDPVGLILPPSNPAAAALAYPAPSLLNAALLPPAFQANKQNLSPNPFHALAEPVTVTPLSSKETKLPVSFDCSSVLSKSDVQEAPLTVSRQCQPPTLS